MKSESLLRSTDLVYPRDASWNLSGREATGTLKYHFESPEDRAMSACGRVGLLNRLPSATNFNHDGIGEDPATIPAHKRCQRHGCKERWPK